MEVRFFKQSEKEILLKFIDEHWSKNHIYVRNPVVMEHLVLNTPYRKAFAGEENYSVVGIWDDDGSVAAIEGFIPQELNVAGKTYLSTSGTVWKVDKENHHFVNGLDTLFYVIDNHDKLGTIVTLGLSDASYKIQEALGWKMIADFPRWIVVNNIDAVNKLLPDNTVEKILPIPKEVIIDLFDVQYDDVSSSKWDFYYEKMFAPVTIGTKRDYKFLKWRYMDSPVLKYHTITVSKNGDYYGLAVIRIERILDESYKIGRILEFISLDCEASVQLAQAILDYDKDVLMWDFYCLSGITAFGIETVGFKRIPSWMNKVMMPTRFQPIDYSHLKINGGIYIADSLKEKISSLDNSFEWYITKGDADQDRAN